METSGLSASQPLLILVVGIPGSGKSFFARQFAEKYKFFCIDTGRYESELAGLHSSNKDVMLIAKKLANATFEEALKSFKHIVLEGSFNTKREREVIVNKAKKAGFEALVVWTQTDLETAEMRATNRDRRRADDKFSLSLSPQEFGSLCRSFEKPVSAKENFVVVSGKHDFKSQSVIVLKKIAGMYVGNMNGGSGTKTGGIGSSRPIIR
jgi:predicted kinase